MLCDRILVVLSTGLVKPNNMVCSCHHQDSKDREAMAVSMFCNSHHFHLLKLVTFLYAFMCHVTVNTSWIYLNISLAKSCFLLCCM